MTFPFSFLFFYKKMLFYPSHVLSRLLGFCSEIRKLTGIPVKSLSAITFIFFLTGRKMVIFLAQLQSFYVILKKMLSIKIQHVFMALFEMAAVVLRKISQRQSEQFYSGAVQMCACSQHCRNVSSGGLGEIMGGQRG